jgi:hypothetical protein
MDKCFFGVVCFMGNKLERLGRLPMWMWKPFGNKPEKMVRWKSLKT